MNLQLRKLIFLLFAAAVILFSIGSVLLRDNQVVFPWAASRQKQQPSYREEASPSTEEYEKDADNPVTVEREVIRELVFYEIKGISNQLSAGTWEYLKNWRAETVEWARQNPDSVIINGQTDEKLVSLTFDDGPDSYVTYRIIEILNEYKVQGTFFFLGTNARAFPTVVKKAHDDGHLVLPHSYNHANYTDKSYDFIYQDFQRTNEVIKNVTGSNPAFMRPPYGVVTENVIMAAESHNQKIIIWSTDTLDWSQREKDNIAANVLDNVRPGEIVLMHSIETNQATALALPEIIEGLHARGYRIVRLDQLIE